MRYSLFSRNLLKQASLLAVTSLLLAGCKEKNTHVDVTQLHQDNFSKVTISQGVAGTLVRYEGNCMPGVLDGSCLSFPVQNTVCIFAPTTAAQVSGGEPYKPTDISTSLLAQTDPDADGFFQLALDTGIYSLIIREDGHYYVPYTGAQYLGEIHIYPDSVAYTMVSLNYAAW